MSMKFKEAFSYYWFKPYTPIIILFLLVFIIVWFVLPTVKAALKPNPSYLTLPTPQLDQIKATQAASNILSNQTTLSNLGKLIELPNDEEPTIANITDTQKFQDQPFFKKAQVADMLIVYQKNKKAILYRPSENKVIELAPILEPTSKPSPATASAQPTQKNP